MSYELSAYPLSLFEASSLLRKADKPKLADAIVKLVKNEGIDRSIDRNEDDLTHQFVLDGGSLLHRHGWKKNITYGEIADSYCTFVVSKYGKQRSCLMVIMMGHLRRNQKHGRREIVVSRNTKCTVSKDEFLSNDQNKDQLIRMIGTSLEKEGCEVMYEYHINRRRYRSSSFIIFSQYREAKL